MNKDAKGASCEELILELRKEGSSRSPEAVAASVPGDPWGIDVGLGHLLMRAAAELQRLSGFESWISEIAEASEGVAGWHKNGDVWPWEDVLETFRHAERDAGRG